MAAFDTSGEAKAFVSGIVDVPVKERLESVGSGVNLHAFPIELGDGCFTNVYDVNCQPGAVAPTIHVHDHLTSIYDFAKQGEYPVVTGGGFFYLADVGSATPKQLALNLAVANHHVRSLPVVDREAIVSDGRSLVARPVKSLGSLSLNGHELSWSGSLTAHETDVKVFGNGNAVITHESSETTGSVRVLDEKSRLTPPIAEEDLIDIGFVAREDGVFIGKGKGKGGIDIFTHDLVLRCHERYLAADQEMIVHTVGGMALDGTLHGALSVGPMLLPQDFSAHQINQDKSLGGKPPSLERPLARTVLYETSDGVAHIRLFDGRPGSEAFPGITPSEAVAQVRSEDDVVWGVFLDPGQTAKLCIRNGDGVRSIGNRHYLKWATKPGEKYVWVPETGRPVASMITLR